MRYLFLFLLVIANQAYAADSCEMIDSGHLIDSGPLISGSLISGKNQVAFDCFVDWRAVKNSKIHYQWVDVRPKQDFSTVHINGSINVAPHLIKTKTYLKQQPLLIIDHGASYRRLWRLCKELKQAGFEQVNILKGGINTAIAEGYSANGDSNTAKLLTITPKMAMEEFYLGGTLFIVSDKKTQQLLSAKKISPQLVKQISNSLSFFSELGRVRYQGDSSANTLKSMVIVDVLADQDYGSVNRSKLLSNVYFLEGGVEALLQFLDSSEWSKIKQLSHPERFSCKL
jgi:rhodanese-related sulfurtransferase